MNLWESLGISWRTIRDHPLRSTLTTLGVIIGVAAVILFVTLSASLQAAILGDFQFGSPQNIWLRATHGDSQPPGSGRTAPVFTDADRQALAQLEEVQHAIPWASVRTIDLVYANQRTAVNQARTTSAPFFGAEGHTFIDGGPFTEGELQVVLRESMVDRFDPAPAVGDTVNLTLWDRSQQVELVVSGIITDPDQEFQFIAPTGGGQVFLPWDPFHPASGGDGSEEAERFNQLIIVAADVTAVDRVAARVEAYLHEESEAAQHLPEEYAFQLVTNERVLEQIRTFINTFTGFISSIALISLLVGSIGIANIMLVSVTERTREIGIMKALGALRRDILVLFLSEAVIIGVVGSLLGAALGVGGAYLAAGYIDLPFTFPLIWAVVAMAVGVLVGMLSGIYPAWKAARVDPIEALRYE